MMMEIRAVLLMREMEEALSLPVAPSASAQGRAAVSGLPEGWQWHGALPWMPSPRPVAGTRR